VRKYSFMGWLCYSPFKWMTTLKLKPVLKKFKIIKYSIGLSSTFILIALLFYPRDRCRIDGIVAPWLPNTSNVNVFNCFKISVVNVSSLHDNNELTIFTYIWHVYLTTNSLYIGFLYLIYIGLFYTCTNYHTYNRMRLKIESQAIILNKVSSPFL
jgi:hypothetical protein